MLFILAKRWWSFFKMSCTSNLAKKAKISSFYNSFFTETEQQQQQVNMADFIFLSFIY